MKPVAGTLLIALLTLPLCGILLACLDGFEHYASLTAGVPVSTLLAFALLVALGTMLVIPGRATGSPGPRFRSASGEPDTPLWLPLRDAFADGILNPKPY